MVPLRVLAPVLFTCAACAQPATVVHVVFSSPIGQAIDSISVEVSIAGSDGGVNAMKSAADTDAGLAGTLDLTIDVPAANLGLCVTHEPAESDPATILLSYTYRLTGDTQDRVGGANRACRRHATYETSVALAGPPAWQLESSNTMQTLNGVWADAATGEVFAVGVGGTVLHSRGSRCAPQPDCAAWTTQPTPTTQLLAAVWGLDAKTVYAVGFGATVLVWDGASWTPHPAAAQIGSDANFLGVWASSPNDIYAVGQQASGAALYHFDGNTFSALPIGGTVTAKTLRGVWGATAGDVYAVGVGTPLNAILENTGSGFELCEAVRGVPTNVTGSSRGAIVTGTMGYTWDLTPGCAPLAPPHQALPPNDLHAGWVGRNVGDVFLVGASGTIFRGESVMAEMQGSPALTAQDLNGVFGVDDGDIYAVGTGGTIVHFH